MRRLCTSENVGARWTATNKLSPDAGIAVDVVPATDDPSNDAPSQQNIPVALRGGPTISTGPNTDPVVGSMLVQAAGRIDVPFQPDALCTAMFRTSRDR